MFNILIGEKCLQKSRQGDHGGRGGGAKPSKQVPRASAALPRELLPWGALGPPALLPLPSRHAGGRPGSSRGFGFCQEAVGELPPCQRTPHRHQGKLAGVWGFLFVCFIRAAGKKALLTPSKAASSPQQGASWVLSAPPEHPKTQRGCRWPGSGAAARHSDAGEPGVLEASRRCTGTVSLGRDRGFPKPPCKARSVGRGPESCRSFCSSSPQSEAGQVTPKDTGKSSKTIHYKYTAAGKGAFPLWCLARTSPGHCSLQHRLR